MFKDSTKQYLEKYEHLLKLLKEYDQLAIAYSGGVDSTLLLFAALEAKGKDNVYAFIVNGEAITETEFEEAIALIKRLHVPYEIIKKDFLKIINESGNDRNRCYYCKIELFTTIIKLAKEKGFDKVLDGTNLDDEKDFRPGMKALKELGVLSPLKEVGLTKNEIRKLSRSFDLPTWDKPSAPCLISRFPYNVKINKEALERTAKAEEYLRELGFKKCRVRNFDKKAVVEVEQELVYLALRKKKSIRKFLKTMGYQKVTIDKEGYRMGKMNET